MSDWRDSYDEWKLRSPDWDDGPTCDRCGEFLTQAGQPPPRWFCKYCEYEDAYWQSLIDGEGYVCDLEDAEFLADGI